MLVHVSVFHRRKMFDAHPPILGGPPVVPFYPCLGEDSPTEKEYLIPTSPLEDLGEDPPKWTSKDTGAAAGYGTMDGALKACEALGNVQCASASFLRAGCLLVAPKGNQREAIHFRACFEGKREHCPLKASPQQQNKHHMMFRFGSIAAGAMGLHGEDWCVA